MIENNMQWCAFIRSFSCLCFRLLHFETHNFVIEAFLLSKCRFLIGLLCVMMRWELVFRFLPCFVYLSIILSVVGELLYNCSVIPL